MVKNKEEEIEKDKGKKALIYEDEEEDEEEEEEIEQNAKKEEEEEEEESQMLAGQDNSPQAHITHGKGRVFEKKNVI